MWVGFTQPYEGLKRTKKAKLPPRKMESFLPVAFELGHGFSHLQPGTTPLPVLILRSVRDSDWNHTPIALGVHLSTLSESLGGHCFLWPCKPVSDRNSYFHILLALFPWRALRTHYRAQDLLHWFWCHQAGFTGVSEGKNPPAMQEMWVWSLGL